MDKVVIFIIVWLEFLHMISAIGDNLIRGGTSNRRHFQVVKPVFYYNGVPRETTHEKDGQHLENATLYFQAFNKDFLIDLKVNRYLFSKSYIEKQYSDEKRFSIHRPKIEPSSHCYYHGSVRGSVHSIVAVSTCDGIRGLITHRGATYHIEPSPNLGSGSHKLYIEKDDPPFHKHTCGENIKHSRLYTNATVNYLHTKEILYRKRRDVRGPYDGNDNTRFVEMFVVNDNSLYRRYRNRAINDEYAKRQIYQRSKDIINIVSRLYNPLNIYIALVGVEIWTGRDAITVSSRANETLEQFLSYRRRNINPYHQNDNAQLITGIAFNEGVVGKAIKASICTHQYSAGVAMDIEDRLTQVATTVAHELGHNFGMAHDNYSYCQCPADKCIMAPTGGGRSSPTVWSSCSRNALAENFDIGMDYCLRNKPEELFESPVCGNGFVEDGEQCDCGSLQDCKTKCCNASTCKLSVGAVCATGKCCDISTCRFKPKATLCRGAYEECDLPEFCNGESEYCPSDVYRQNGVECGNGQSYCYNGTCKTHSAQCKLLWGSTGRVSDPICFQHLNTKGEKHGNCGYDWTSGRYQRCDKEDVLCGLLHCVHQNEKLMFWRETLVKATPATFLTKGSKLYVCRSAILDVGLNMPDPGQVPDGAKCDEGKICYNHKCTSLSKIPSQPCPDCNNNGVCNSLGQCHCNEGFAPPLCNEPGHGGSVHSGPVKIKGNNDLLVGLLVTFALIIIIGFLAFLGFIYRERLKKWLQDPGDLKNRMPCFALPAWKQPPRNNDKVIRNEAINRNPNNQVDISTPVFQGSTSNQSRTAVFTSKKQEKQGEKVALKPPSKAKPSVPRPEPPKVAKPEVKAPPSSVYQNVAPTKSPKQESSAESSLLIKSKPGSSDSTEAKSLFSKISNLKPSKGIESNVALKPVVKPQKSDTSVGRKPEFTPSPKPIVKPGTKLAGKESTSTSKQVVRQISDPKTSATRQDSNTPGTRQVNDSKKPATRQDSNTSGNGVALRREPISRDISNPVLISTTDRRSQGYLQDIKDAQLVVPPPVPSHANSNGKSGGNGKPQRPKSMPLQAQNTKSVNNDEKKKSRKSSVIESNPKSPPRPPPPNMGNKFSDTNNGDKELPFKSVEKHKYKLETEEELPLAKNRSPVPKFRKTKLPSEEETSVKPLLSKTGPKLSTENKSYYPENDQSQVRSQKPSRSPPKLKPKLTKTTSAQDDGSVEEAPAVLQIKAMFDSMDVGKKSVFGSNSSIGQVGVKSQPATGDTRPKPSPKPSGAKLRSVNV